MDKKQCSQCEISKPLSEFYRDLRAKDGKRSACRGCERVAVMVAQEKRRYNQNNKVILAARRKRYRRKRRERDPKFRLNSSMSKRIQRVLGGNKKNRGWLSLVPYTVKSLIQHLEGQFKDGMAWENYGEWHIDHIIPVSVFNFKHPEDIDFK